jgi:hypothetical protein
MLTPPLAGYRVPHSQPDADVDVVVVEIGDLT